ncbi:MAG: AbgT family transporter [Coriobacteriia bacterium]|nr:AbgT family transporter [Coriobacteriia bacterium]
MKEKKHAVDISSDTNDGSSTDSDTSIARNASGGVKKTHSADNDNNSDGSNAVGGITGITIRTYVTAFVVLLVLMVAAYVLTLVLPAGEFNRTTVDGAEVIDPGSYHETEGNLPFWKWILSPLLILGGPNRVMIIFLLVFLLAIGGAFYALESCGVLGYLITSIARRFEKNNRLLLFILPLIFMLLGTLIGSFEEVIPLVAIVVALSLRLGWDRLQGLGMSLLAVGCGFSVAVMNPFTAGIAQTLAGLAIFSGAWLRIVSFVLVYALLMTFLLLNARRCEKAGIKNRFGLTAGTTSVASASTAATANGTTTTDVTTDVTTVVENGSKNPIGRKEDVDPRLSKALKAFVIVFVIGIAAIISCSIIPLPGLSDIVFPVCALTFLLCGIISPLICGCGMRQWILWFFNGMKAIAPGALLVLMASSISFMLTEGKVLDTIIFYANNFLADKPGGVTILGIYALIMILEFAIPSGSAKAFLLIPLLAPLVDLIDINRQLLVLAYVFGDGFTNVFYPTNPALLIALSLGGLSYGKWIKKTWPFFAALLILTSALLLIGLAIGYQ